MAQINPTTLPSMRKQKIQAEFAGLKQACPEGVFVSLTPNDPTLWSAILFVREGPYAPAVLRFHISFPISYPEMPPVVSFSTDMFHPLVTPLTTYTYTTDIQDNGTVSATDDERLPLGGFSLRHGFPMWFGRGRRSTNEVRKTGLSQPRDSSATLGQGVHASPSNESESGGKQSSHDPPSIYSILKYIRSTFDDEDVLDTVPLEAAGNPGAWHAWRTRRRNLAKSDAQKPREGVEAQPVDATPMSSDIPTTHADKDDVAGSRTPEDWNWDGVWEDRVRKGIATSLSESVLYGGTSNVPEDLINFLPMEEADIETVKENIRRVLRSPA